MLAGTFIFACYKTIKHSYVNRATLNAYRKWTTIVDTFMYINPPWNGCKVNNKIKILKTLLVFPCVSTVRYVCYVYILSEGIPVHPQISADLKRLQTTTIRDCTYSSKANKIRRKRDSHIDICTAYTLCDAEEDCVHLLAKPHRKKVWVINTSFALKTMKRAFFSLFWSPKNDLRRCVCLSRVYFGGNIFFCVHYEMSAVAHKINDDGAVGAHVWRVTSSLYRFPTKKAFLYEKCWANWKLMTKIIWNDEPKMKNETISFLLPLLQGLCLIHRVLPFDLL